MVSVIRIVLLTQLLVCTSLAQPADSTFYFVSDTQQPLFVERIFRHPYRNIEGRDSIFAGIIRQHPKYLFMLGDLTGAGSRSFKWQAVDSFLSVLHANNCQTYAIPGNHEYFFNAKKGIRNYTKRFGAQRVMGYCFKKANLSVVMLNSNFRSISKSDNRDQVTWYQSIMDSLDNDVTIQSIIVATHHSPYTNSIVVKPSEQVENYFVKRFEQSPKTKLFLSGHSHNLEYFIRNNKKFLVIGGGGGVVQTLSTGEKQEFKDIFPQNRKPVFFYIVVYSREGAFDVKIYGLNKEFNNVVLSLPMQ